MSTSKKTLVSLVIILAALAAIALVLPHYLYAKESGSPVGSIVSWKGDVTVFRAGDREGVRINKTEAVYVGDYIVTSSGSKAKLLMKDDTILSVGPSGKLRITKFLYDRRKRTRASSFDMFKGTIRALATRYFSRRSSTFNIVTPTAIVGVKGTDFMIETNDKWSEVMTLKGEVKAKSSKRSVRGEVTIRPGYASKVLAGAPPSRPKKADTGRLKELMEETAIPVTAPLELMEGGCYSCHSEVYREMTSYEYQHPGIKDACIKCHIKDTKKERVIELEEESRSNLVVLEDLKADMPYSVRVRLKDKKGLEGISRKVVFKPALVAKREKDTGRPPSITDAKVTRLAEGMFYEADVEWKTDKPTLSRVDYGTSKKLGDFRYEKDQYVTDHKVTIDQLKRGKTYHVKVSSKDVFGRSSSSEMLKFKVKDSFGSKKKSSDAPPEVTDISIVDVGGRPALKWRASKKAKAKIEVGEHFSREEAVKRDPHSPGLRSLVETGIDVCMECHNGKIHKRTSHPTGIVDWGLKSMPYGLILGEDDTLLCATCHTPHGGTRGYFLRMEERELCENCHRTR